MMAAARATAKPADCALGLALPASRGDFLADLLRPEADFARRFRYWRRYRQECLRPLIKGRRRLTALGASVIPGLTLEAFGGLFRRGFAVVILFAHSASRRVELRDGLVSAEAVVERVPSSWRGTLDLCVCHPRPLTEALRRDRPSCTIRYTGRATATPELWLGFYYALMHRLYHEDLTYLRAFEMTVAEFQETRP